MARTSRGTRERYSTTNTLLLRGGSRVEPGAYREVRTGHVVYLGTEGYLPGQINSERYVQVPERVYLQERLHWLLHAHAAA